MSIAADMPLLTSGLVVGYSGHGLNRPFTAEVGRGGFVALLGANGSGKSTLLRTLAGSQAPVAGKVEVAGRDISGFTPAELARYIAVVTTDRVEADALTVREVVEMGRYPYTGFFGRLDGSDRRIVDEAMAFTGVAPMAARFVASLSDGERQKVMIARALAQDTPLMLLDEPTSFLDVASRIEVLSLLARLARERRKAVVLSTHDVSSALGHASALWLMMPDGKIVATTPAEALASHEAFLTDGGCFSPLDGLFAARGIAFDGVRLDYRSTETP